MPDTLEPQKETSHARDTQNAQTEAEETKTSKAHFTGTGTLPAVGGGGEHTQSASDLAYGGEHAKKEDAGGEHEGKGEHSKFEKLEHWCHQYANVMHEPHIAAEALEQFADIVAELGAHDVHEFMEGIGGSVFKKTLAVLCIPMAFAHASEYVKKAQEAAAAGNTAGATYYWSQALLQAGSASPVVGLACTFVSEMLQVSEGKGLVYKYLVTNLQNMDGNKLRSEADVVFDNHTTLGDLSNDRDGGASAKLDMVKDGFKTRDAAFDELRHMRADSMFGQEDYAVTQDPGGTFAIHKLKSNQPLAFDMDDKRELESAVLPHDNAFHIVALVAEDGTWGRVEKVPMDGGGVRFDVKAAGHL